MILLSWFEDDRRGTGTKLFLLGLLAVAGVVWG